MPADRIMRRDFLNYALLGTGASLLKMPALFADAGFSPPELNGHQNATGALAQGKRAAEQIAV